MKIKYEKFGVNIFNELPTGYLPENKSFYETFYSQELNCEVVEAYYVSTILSVYYFSPLLNEEIKEFHSKKYGRVKLVLCERINRSVKYTYIPKNEIVGYSIISYDTDENPTISHDFNRNFELTEYRVYQYNEQGEEIGIKIFYPDNWTIHEEDSIM